MDPECHEAQPLAPDDTSKEVHGGDSLAIVPPYWQHQRHESYASVDIIRPPPIVLEDHTDDEPQCRSPLWAKKVVLEDYIVVSGNLASVGNYIVWSCKIGTLDVGLLSILLYFLAKS